MRRRVASVFLLVIGFAHGGHANEPTKSADESAIKQVTTQLLKAYQDEDANEFAALFTTDGEYVDLKGVVFHGRAAIETEFAAFFREVPDSTIRIEFSAIRKIAPNVIVADCTISFKSSAKSPSIPGRCQLVCSRDGEQWRIASLRETESLAEASPHHAKVSQLEWLIGEWIGEGAHSQVHFSCRWDESGHYLLRDFTVETGGPQPLKGTQRIGYDPSTKQLKIWVFDSAGGYSEGVFEQDGEAWIVRTAGVTPDGRVASSINSLKRLDDHRVLSEAVDRSVGGERLGVTEKLTLVRKPVRTLNRSSSVDVSSKPEDFNSVPETTTNRK